MSEIISDTLVAGEIIKPDFDENEVLKLSKKLYGLSVEDIQQLPGYDDRNYKLKVSNVNNKHIEEIWPHGYVLKIVNSTDSKKPLLIEGQNELMIFLGSMGFQVPQPVKNLEGEYCSEILKKGGKSCLLHIVKLLTFQPGNILKSVPPHKELLHNVGSYLADVDLALKSFTHPGYSQGSSIWMLQNLPELKKITNIIEDKFKLSLVNESIHNFEAEVLPQLEHLEKGIIHGDYNEHNILVKGNKVVSLLDYNDSHYGPYLFEVAIGLTYILLYADNLEAGKYFLSGYTEKRKLSTLEKQLIHVCVCGRFCQSLVLGAYSYKYEPGNEYLLSSQTVGWKLLRILSAKGRDELNNIWEL